MIDWDDVRYFLAVARGGSVRAAAERLGVNHATVLRRIAQFEERLGVQMFESLIPQGKMGRPEDIATVGLFLASDDSSYANGVELAVDGGFSAI